MERQLQATHISDVLNYLHLLPKDEQLNELRTILTYFKNHKQIYNKRYEQNPLHTKLMKKVLHLTNKNLRE